GGPDQPDHGTGAKGPRGREGVLQERADRDGRHRGQRAGDDRRPGPHRVRVHGQRRPRGPPRCIPSDPDDGEGVRGSAWSRGETEAVVVDRAMFDRAIVTEALRSGAHSFLGAQAAAARRDDSSVEVLVDQDGQSRRLRCKILIGADGVRSSVAKWFNILRPKKILPGFEVEMVGVESDPGLVQLFVGHDYAPGFFGWIIPSGDNASVGLCMDEGMTYDYVE